MRFSSPFHQNQGKPPLQKGGRGGTLVPAARQVRRDNADLIGEIQKKPPECIVERA